MSSIQKYIASLLILLFAAHAHAADPTIRTSPSFTDDPNSSNHFLLEAGYIGATTTDQPNFADFQHGFAGGLLIDAFGRHTFTFESGLFFYQQGFKYSTDAQNLPNGNQVSGATVKGTLTYIGIPLLGKINLSGRLTNTAFLIGGVVPQYLVNKQLNVQGTDANQAPVNTNVVGDDYDVPQFDVTGTIGFGGNVAVSRTQSVLLQFTYNRGFIPLDYDLPNPGTYNQSFLLTVGFGTDL